MSECSFFSFMHHYIEMMGVLQQKTSMNIIGSIEQEKGGTDGLFIL